MQAYTLAVGQEWDRPPAQLMAQPRAAPSALLQGGVLAHPGTVLG